MTRTISQTRLRHSTARLAIIAMFVALIIVGAFIKVPIGIVPVSLQCTVCILCALLLGPWDALICVTIYLAMGLVGIPVFTMGGGPYYVFQPTFGYLLGYLIALPICGIVARGVRCAARPRFFRLFAGALTAIAIVYAAGIAYMYFMLNFYLGTNITLSKAVVTGGAVFLPTDISFAVLSCIVASKVIPFINKHTYAAYGSERNRHGSILGGDLYYNCAYVRTIHVGQADKEYSTEN